MRVFRLMLFAITEKEGRSYPVRRSNNTGGLPGVSLPQIWHTRAVYRTTGSSCRYAVHFQTDIHEGLDRENIEFANDDLQTLRCLLA
jgi:hypothetical protein